MALKTSLLIAGDSSGAVAATDAANTAMAGNEKQAQALANAYAATNRTIGQLAATQATAKAETDATKASFAAGEITLEQYNRELLQTKSALSLVGSQHTAALGEVRKLSAGVQGTVGPSKAAQAGYINLGRQAQDVAVHLQSGTNLGTIMAQQGGQVADALAQMGGKFSGVASFLAGPWGAAIIVGTGLLVNMVQAFFANSDAADKNSDALAGAKVGADGLAAAQSVLGNIFDLTSGRIKNQNELLILNARLTAINLRSEALAKRASAADTFGGAGSGSLNTLAVRFYGGSLFTGREDPRNRNAYAARDLVSGVQSGKITRDAALQQTEKLDLQGLKVTKQELQQAILDSATADLNLKAADLIDKSLDDKSLAGGLRRTDTKKAPGAKRTPRTGDPGAQAAKSAELGEDIASRIAGIKDQFSDLPPIIAQSNRALLQLKDIASDVERKKPPNYAAIVADLAGARKAIEDSLTKPFDDFLEKSRELAQIDALIGQGRDDEAEALQRSLDLIDKQGSATDQQLESVLSTVRAERDRALVLRDQRALIDANVDAVRDLRASLEGTVGDLLTGKFSIKRILGSLTNSAVTIISKRVVESAFGGFLRDLEKSATSKLDKAETDLAGSFDSGGKAVTDFADVVRKAVAAINGTLAGPQGTVDANGTPENVGADIIVERNRQPENQLIDMVDATLKKFGVELPESFKKAAKDALGRLEEGLSGSLGKIVQGAGTGVAVAQIGKMFGLKTSSTGGAIGGAIGGLTGIPGGQIIGSIAGALIGGLLKKTKSGSATIGSVNGVGAVTGTGGNSQSRIGAARGLAGSALDALDRIVEALGGQVGSFAASIAVRNKKFVVDPTGAGRTKGAGTQKFASEEEAAKALLADIISDGAVKGISAAVQKALRSSSDIDKALKEALKVQEVELAIGGIGAALTKAFRDFERQATERLRIGKEYGFDLVKLEERNAKDRLKLSEQLLADQVGSLQRLIDELTGGSLFEGSAVDKRTAILGQIAAAKTAADAGEEGAADKLSGLLEQLNAVSKDVFATTGGFATDRASILDQARDTIARANQRITDAQKGSDPALTATNAALDENNDQNAQIIATLAESNVLLGAIAAQGGTIDFSYLANLAKTSGFGIGKI